MRQYGGRCTDGVQSYLHLLQEKGSAPLPYQMEYNARRGRSCEERVVHQLELEHSWDGTPAEGLWRRFRLVAVPAQDYRLPRRSFVKLLQLHGIFSSTLQDNLYRLFLGELENSRGCISGLAMCKVFEIAFNQPVMSQHLVGHCFRSLPIEIDTQLVTERSIEARLGFLSKKSSSCVATLERHCLDFLGGWMRKNEIQSIGFETFALLFKGEECANVTELFIKPILEASFKVFQHPFGTFPKIPPRWMEAAEPLPFRSDVPADADSLLLQKLESKGVKISDR